MAIDPGVRTGYAIGDAAELPRVGAVVLKRRGQDAEVAAGNMACWLRDTWVLDRPDLVVLEHFLHPKAQPSGDAAICSLLLAGVVFGLARIYGVEVRSPYAQETRKHFCGQANAGDRASTNLMVLRRAIALGYLPRESTDWDRANAAALFDLAAAKYANKTPKALVLFGEGARA